MKTNLFFYCQFHQNQDRPFFVLFVRKSDRENSGMKGWCKSIHHAVKSCFENQVTNPFIISTSELAAEFAFRFDMCKLQSCYFVNFDEKGNMIGL